MNRVTCLTFSLEPFDRLVPEGCSYVNQNSKFSDETGFLAAMIAGVDQITTEDMFICDSDDPLPLSIPKFSTGLIYGDFYFTTIRKNIPDTKHIIVSDNWDEAKHLAKWYLIHKPIMKTEYVKKVLPHITSHRFMHVQHAVHYLIAMTYGSTYSPEFIASWNKHETGLHLVDQKNKVSWTRNWLKVNKDRIHKLLTNPL